MVAPTVSSSPPPSNHLSLTVELAAEEKETFETLSSPCKEEQDVRESKAPSKSNRKRSHLRKILRRDEHRRSRSASPTRHEQVPDWFFGLSQEFSFTETEATHDQALQHDPAFKDFIEALPEDVFSNSDQRGLAGMDRYLATPRSADAVRYFRP